MKTVQSKFHHSTIRALGLGSLIAGACVCAQAQTIILGTSSSYAVLASTTITSTGTTILTGDLGLSPGTAVTGSPTVTGSSHINDPTAATARADATTAYNQLAALTATQSLTGDLGGRTLTPGIYNFGTSAGLTGTLTLDGLNQVAPLFVFQIGSTLTTATSSSMVLTNNASAGNVWFQVGSSATFGTGSSIAGTFISSASDTLVTGVTVNGRIFALTGAITLDTSHVSVPTAVPEPAGAALLLGAVALVGVLVQRKRTVAASV